MKRRHAFVQIVLLAVSAALMYWSISAEGIYRIAGASIAMVLMVSDAVVFASASRDVFSKLLSILISAGAILAATAIASGSVMAIVMPEQPEVVEETVPVAEETVPAAEEIPEVEPPRIPSAPVVSVRGQEIDEGEPETVAGKGSASIPTAPEVFNLIWIEE